MTNTAQIVSDLLQLQDQYASTYRTMTTAERYRNLVESGILTTYTYDTEAIREPLIEHVGHLPIIAAYLYPHIQHSSQINLGRSLIMLAVHDIGETKAGDLHFTKSEQNKKLENQAANQLLPANLLSYFQEFEQRNSLDAKFAKSVDAIAPPLHELTLPKVTIQRFKHFNYSVDVIEKRKKFFDWDKVLLQIFNEVIRRFRKIEQKYGNVQ